MKIRLDRSRATETSRSFQNSRSWTLEDNERSSVRDGRRSLARTVLITALICTVLLASAQAGLRVAEATPYQPHDPIVIDGNDGFIQANGVVSGNGTASNPYVIGNWSISAVWPKNGVVIGNTSAYFVIRNVDISTTNSTGILLANVTNARLENLQIHANDRRKQAIWMTRVSNSAVQGSSLNNYDVAFLMTFVDHVQVLDNVFPSNLGGISLGFSTNVTVSRNMFAFNGLVLFGSSRAHLNSHNITQDNLVNGKPLRYYAGCTNLNLDGIEVGQLIIADCSNVRVANLDLSRSEMPLQLIRVNGAVVQNNNVSSGNIVGFVLSNSTNISVTANNFSNNLVGIRVWTSRNILLYHNNFVKSALGRHASDEDGVGNQWDNGYPSGGNYWSDYPGQDSDGDGIGDIPYSVYPNSTDRYPLVQPYVATHDVAITEVETSPMSVTQGETVTVTVGVKNEGNMAENLSVTVLVGGTPFGSQNVTGLAPRTFKTLIFYWETTEVAPGNYTVKAIASAVAGEVDTADNAMSAPPITVNRVEHAPVLGPISAQTAHEGTLLTFNVTAADGNGDPLSFSLGPDAPDGATITQEGIFSWTPAEDQGDEIYHVTTIVRDTTGRNDSEVVSITVLEVNRAPVLNVVSDKTAIQGSVLRFKATASDSDLPLQTLAFSLEPSTDGPFPEGAAITADGTFSWTPSLDQEPGLYIVRIVVSDGKVMDSEEVLIILERRQAMSLTSVLSWLPWISIGLFGLFTSMFLLLRRVRGRERFRESRPEKPQPLQTVMGNRLSLFLGHREG